MVSVCLYFKVHQPFHLKPYSSMDVDVSHCYEDAEADRETINNIADNCYLPANEIILSQINEHEGKFKINYSISGTLLEQLQQYRPDVIDSFKTLTATGCANILAETYYHSLSFLHSRREFQRQIFKHFNLVKDLLDFEPTVFRNTELIYNNDLALFIADLGFRGILCEGVKRILTGRSVNKVYAAPDIIDFGLLLRNTTLSDDIAFRFGDNNWSEHPLTADKFAEWIYGHPSDTEVINLFMDYETIGIHKKAGSGIFDFLKALPQAILSNTNFTFNTATGALDTLYPKDIYNVPKTISWDDNEQQSCVWCENMMQNNTLKKIYSLEKMVHRTNDEEIINTWGRLQSADYFYYMAENSCSGYKYVNPFKTSHEAFQYYTNIVTDFELRLIKKELQKNKTDFLPAMSTLY
jgi:alpha-amylase